MRRVFALDVLAYPRCGGRRRVLALLQTNPRPTEDEIRHGLSAVLCRCTGYQGILAAVAAAAAALAPPR